MNLLKVILVILCVASASLILPATAQAVDHPWDDNTLDSSRTTSDWNNRGDTLSVLPDRPIMRVINTWIWNVFREVTGVVIGGVKAEVKAQPRERETKRVESPVSHKKNK